MPDVRLFDSRELRRTLGSFVTGVTVVTTIDDGGRFHGLTANSFSSVSLDPPLVLWSQAAKAHSHSVFFRAERFAVNILAEDQTELSNRFAKPSAEKFAGLNVDIGLGGLPLLRGCAAWLQCRVFSRVPGGDHTIYVGEVLSIDRAERKPLAFGNGQYLTIDSYDLADNARSLGRKQDQLAAMRLGARAIERLARKFDQTMALAVWGSHGPTIVQWEPSAAPVSDDLPLGLTLPVTSTATGLAFAAHLPSAAIAGTLWRDQAASEERDWETRLWEVRRLGLARQELETFYRTETLINALSAPVLDASGQAVLALTAVGEAKKFSADLDADFAHALRETAHDLSGRLGYRDSTRPSGRQLELAAGA